jgi:hypothetical protein
MVHHPDLALGRGNTQRFVQMIGKTVAEETGQIKPPQV